MQAKAGTVLKTTQTQKADEGPSFPDRYRLIGALRGTALLGGVLLLVWLLAYVWTPAAPPFWPSLILLAALLALAWWDFRHFLLPDLLTLPLIALGVFIAWVDGRLLLSLMGAAIGYGVILALYLYWRWRFSKTGIGLGDAKLMAAAGAWCGAFAIPLILLVSSVSALTLILAVSGFRRARVQQTAFAFGPFICLGFWTSWMLGPLLVQV